MEAITSHDHEFRLGEWPFASPSNAVAFSSVRVTRKEWPILMVYHDHNGDWQFHYGYIEDDDEISVVCLGCIYHLDPTIGLVADLPTGWVASRDSLNAPWQRQPFEEDDVDG